MTSHEIRAMFQIAPTQGAPQWDDLESEQSLWRPLCPRSEPFSVKTIQTVIANQGIYTKAALVDRIKTFVNSSTNNQLSELTCFFPYRDRAIISIKLNLREQSNPELAPDVSEVLVFRGPEELRETYSGLPLHKWGEKEAVMSGFAVGYSYRIFPRCMIDTHELVHTIAGILKERVRVSNLAGQV